MTREEATAYWKQRSEHIHNWLEENEDVDCIGEYVEAIDMAIEALKKMEKAIEINICEGAFDYESGTVTYYSIPKETDIERKQKGEWIFEETDTYWRTYCSVCGASAPFECVSDDYYGTRFHGETRKTNFCPNCGADMRGEK